MIEPGKNGQPNDNFADEQFAKLLQEKHEQLIGSAKKPLMLPDDTSTDPQDERIQSALHVIELLEQIKPVSNTIANQAIDTAADPSTKKSNFGDITRSSQSAETLFPNLESIGRFTINEQIGRGGFGIVLSAYDPRLKRNVAIKIPRFETALSENSRARFAQEARAAAALKHRGIVAVHEVGSQQSIDFIVSELVEGDNLATVLARGQEFTAQQSAELIRELADALEHAHQRGVLHRDIKPSNILIDQRNQGRPKLTDFGLATIEDQGDLTQTGAVIGTPSFMAPEQARGLKHLYGPATDVYALGAVLYELLTGRAPFADLSVVDMLRAITERDPTAPRSLDSTIPRDLEAVCLKCLEKDPRQRYATAQALQADLQRFLNGVEVQARRITTVDRAVRWTRRNPILAGVSFALFTALLTGLVTATVLWKSAELNQNRYQAKAGQLEGIVDRMFDWVNDMPELSLQGMEPVREKMLVDVNEYYTSLLQDSPSDPELKRKRSDTILRLASIKSSLTDFDGSIALASDLINSIRHDRSPIQRQLRIDAQLLIAKNHSHLGNSELQQRILDEALTLARSVYTSTTSPNDAEKIEFAMTLSEAANIVEINGDRTLGNQLALESIAVWETIDEDELDSDQTLLAMCQSFNVAAKTHAASENREVARNWSSKSIQLIEESMDEQFRWTPQVRTLLANNYRFLGISYRLEIDKATVYLDHALEIATQLSDSHPLVPKYKEMIGAINYQRGLTQYVAFMVNKLDPEREAFLAAAMPIFTSNARMLIDWSERFPDDRLMFEKIAASSITCQGLIFEEMNQHENSVNTLNQALEVANRIHAESASTSSRLRVLGLHNNLGMPYMRLERYEQAVDEFRIAIEGLVEILAEDPDNSTAARYLSGAAEYCAECYFALAQHENAAEVYQLSMQAFRESVQETMMGLEAVYLFRADRINDARDRFDRFVEFQQELSQPGSEYRPGIPATPEQIAFALPKLVQHAALLIAAMDERVANGGSEDIRQFKTEVTEHAIRALQVMLDDPVLDGQVRVQQLLTADSLDSLKQTDAFRAWNSGR